MQKLKKKKKKITSIIPKKSNMNLIYNKFQHKFITIIVLKFENSFTDFKRKNVYHLLSTYTHFGT